LVKQVGKLVGPRYVALDRDRYPASSGDAPYHFIGGALVRCIVDNDIHPDARQLLGNRRADSARSSRYENRLTIGRRGHL
jgi:hypothetical protein